MQPSQELVSSEVKTHSLALWRVKCQIQWFENHIPGKRTGVWKTLTSSSRGYPTIFSALDGCLYVFAYPEGNCLFGMVSLFLVNFIMDSIVMCWHPKLMPWLYHYSGLCIQQNVHTSSGSFWQCGFGFWRYFFS